MSETKSSIGLTAKNLVWNGLRRTLSGGPRREALYRRLNHLRFLRREGLLGKSLGVGGEHRGGAHRQPPLTWTLDTPTITTLEGLLSWLDELGVEHEDRGGHTVYIPPQPALEHAFGEAALFYPPTAGFKLLRDLRRPEDARYLAAHSWTPARERLIGAPADQVAVANLLHALDLGPRAYDLAALAGNGFTATAFVVEHVDGGEPSQADAEEFLRALEAALESSELQMLVPYWEGHVDFQPPACNGNLLARSGSARAHYVDFQNFGVGDPLAWTRAVLDAGVDDLHFGKGREERGERYLYQTVPGIGSAAKRDIDLRWGIFRAQLERGGVDLANRVVFDVGCNAGMMLHNALAEGAAWGLGFDLPNVVPHTRRLLWSLGASRFKLTGDRMHPEYDLRPAIPAELESRLSESVIFYLAVREHIGVLPCLAEIPWRAMVFEGHQGEADLDESELRPLFGGAPGRILMNTRMADGDCSDRPIAVLIRD